VSERVPFGTGKAMLKWREQFEASRLNKLNTYQFVAFQHLKELISYFPSFRSCDSKELYDKRISKLPNSIKEFLEEQGFHTTLRQCINQSTSESTFLKRVYAWLDGFKVLKFVHSYDERFPRTGVEGQARLLLQKISPQFKDTTNCESLLQVFRDIDQER